MKYQLSSAALKSLGHTDQEIRLILSRNCTEGPRPILTMDSWMMQSQRYDGLTESDRAIAESANAEWAVLRKSYKRK